MGQKVEITRLEFIPFNFDGKIVTKTFPQGVIVHGKYKDKRLYMTTTSLGGLVTVIYKNHIYRATVDSIELKKFVELLGKNKYVQSGTINGTIFYHKRPRIGHTDLKVTDVVLEGLNLDKKLSTINDALQLNFARALSRTFFDPNSSDITNIDHMQFNIALSHDHFLSTDFALRTENYRLSVGGHVHKRGQINYFDVNLLDKNGCAVVTQKLQGDIRKPKIKSTTTEVVNVAQSIPSSMFGVSINMMNNNSFMGAKKMMTQADNYMKETSKIVMPLDCSVIYDGKVKHPKASKIDF
ncbi:hypothetical protein N9X61_04900 [Sulfurimonas sp.]|nr:hypothetical protein [Sulfurimonas sp.]